MSTRCSHCGTPTERDSRFCPACGTRIEASAGPRRGPLLLLAAAIVSAVTVVALATALLADKEDRPHERRSASERSTSVEAPPPPLGERAEEPPLAPETIARTGDSCGPFEQALTALDATISAEVAISKGSGQCSEILAVIRRYLTAEDLCSGGTNTCALRSDGWECNIPTAGSFPVVLRCTEAEGSTVVVGLDQEALAPAGDSSCGTPSDVEVPGPFSITSNLSCDDAEAIARYLVSAPCSGERCSDVGFVCETRVTGYESLTYTCRFSDARVEFEVGT